MTNETVRYLASYLAENYLDFVEMDFGGIFMSIDPAALEEQIKAFFKELP